MEFYPPRSNKDLHTRLDNAVTDIRRKTRNTWFIVFLDRMRRFLNEQGPFVHALLSIIPGLGYYIVTKKLLKSLMFLLVYVAIALLLPFTLGRTLGSILFFALFGYHSYVMFKAYTESWKAKNRQPFGYKHAIIVSLLFSVLLTFLYTDINATLARRLFVADRPIPGFCDVGDRFLFSRQAGYHRGDVVVYDGNEYAPGIHAERIMGCAGDRISIHDNGIYVNGVSLAPPMYPLNAGVAANKLMQGLDFTVPKGSYCILVSIGGFADEINPANFVHYCTIPVSSVTGKMVARYMPSLEIY